MKERKSYSEGRIFDLSRQTGRSPPTLRRWARQGCDLDDPEALKEFLERMDSRRPAFDRPQQRNFSRVQTQVPPERARRPPERLSPVANGEILPEGQKGAAFALKRLEASEEAAHRRLQSALERGNPLEVESAQSFWLRCSETLRRLDLAVEVARREAETQVPLRTAQDAVTAVAEWLRIAIMQFLSAEAITLMSLKTVGEFKAYFLERLVGNIFLTVKAADKTNSPVPNWAVTRIRTAWNVPD
jgi:hypothetical protein